MRVRWCLPIDGNWLLMQLDFPATGIGGSEQE
jgi:hypothetical protein